MKSIWSKLIKQPSIEEVAKVAEEILEDKKQELEPPKDIVRIEVDGTYSFEVQTAEYNGHHHGYYSRQDSWVIMQYDINVYIEGVLASIPLKSSVNILYSNRVELEVYKLILNYLEGKMDKETTENINNKIERSIVKELNQYIIDNELEKVKELITKQNYQLNISFNVEKTDVGMYERLGE